MCLSRYLEARNNGLFEVASIKMTGRKEKGWRRERNTERFKLRLV